MADRCQYPCRQIRKSEKLRKLLMEETYLETGHLTRKGNLTTSIAGEYNVPDSVTSLDMLTLLMVARHRALKGEQAATTRTVGGRYSYMLAYLAEFLKYLE